MSHYLWQLRFHSFLCCINIIYFPNCITWFARYKFLITDWKFFFIFLNFTINIEWSQQWFGWPHRRKKVSDFGKSRQFLSVTNGNLLSTRFLIYFWSFLLLMIFSVNDVASFDVVAFVHSPAFSPITWSFLLDRVALRFICLRTTCSPILIEILSDATSIVFVTVLGLSSFYSISITFLTLEQ